MSVDPGIRGTGVGVFDGQSLTHGRYVYNPEPRGLGPFQAATMARAIWDWLNEVVGVRPHTLVLEWPQVYRVSKGDPNDLLPLAGVDAALTALLGVKTIHYLPMEWKGQLPKEVMVDRILQRLTPAERVLIPDVGALTHNVIDSVGIGLHHIGRLQPKKVFPR